MPGKTLHQQKRRGHIDPKRLVPFVESDLTKRFYHRDPGIVDQNVERIAANCRDQIGHAFLGGEIVNQFNHAGTLGLDGLARFRERDGIAAVQKQSDIGRREFFGNRPSNATARASDEDSFHRHYCSGGL